MPGLFLAFAENGIGDHRNRFTAKNIPGTVCNIDSHLKLIVDSEKTILGSSHHDNYSPITSEDDRSVIFVDGLIYGKSPCSIIEELKKTAEVSFTGRTRSNSAIKDWILSTDGEYVAVILDKSSGGILIFNDRLGRLPVYYSIHGEMILVARNPWNILKITGSREFDRKAISEYLMFGYPLGNATILKNVYQFGGASCMRIEPGCNEPDIRQLFKYNFDEKTDGSAQIAKLAAEIIELLHEACRARIDNNYNNVLALSGGLDSRTVAVCLRDVGADFRATTFLDPYGMVKPDVVFAEQIARTLGIDQNLTHLSRASGRNVIDMLRIKCGMNYLGVSFSIPMIERIMATHGKKVTLFTGDGGDRVLRDTTPVTRLGSIDRLADYTIRSNSIINPDVFTSITLRDFGELISDLRDTLASYEENDVVSKYLHFIFYERCPKWHFQGEDRNRTFVRHVTPFYASKVFEYCMRLPVILKKDFRLYREILVRLSPSVAAIPNSEWNFPITSRKLKMYCLARQLYFHMPSRARRIIQRRHCYTKKASVYARGTPIRKCLESQLERSEAIGKYLSVDGIRKNIDNMDKTGFDHFFTLTSIMEMIDRGQSSIEEYADADFI